MHNVVIIGSGPAGLTAALYAARAGLGPLCIGGYEPGGQLMLTTEVENFPGFPEGIQGSELMAQMRQQAERFGAEILNVQATEVDFSDRPLRVGVNGDWYDARAVIIATGASAKWLGLESEKRLRGRGVSSCATCDGFFFRGQDVFVVGGGDSAMEEALYLSNLCKSVRIIHRRDELRASKIMGQRAREKGNIDFVWDSIVTEVLGENRVEGVRVQNVKTGETRDLEGAAMFVAIGHKPNTDIFKGVVKMNEIGYIEPQQNTMTDVEGVFVAGDAHDFRYRQAEGARAALDAERWLVETPQREEEKALLERGKK